MPRKKINPADLLQIGQHLGYEVWMFDAIAQALLGQEFPDGPLRNALLESFILHSRNLTDFLWAPANLRDDDIIAGDFFLVSTDWEEKMPKQSRDISLMRARAGKEMMHLTYTRGEMTPQEKEWDVAQIHSEVSSQMLRFVTTAPRENLSDEMIRWGARSGWLEP